MFMVALVLMFPVALILVSVLTFLPKCWIMSCSRVDCQLLSFRCCSETAVTDESIVITDFLTLSTQVMSFPMDLVRHCSNTAGVSLQFFSSTLTVSFISA